MKRPKLLDLFSGAGGAAFGYHRAGFEVVGVDINPQPRYCGDEFHQADAMTFPLDGFDAIHASPPCQRFSVAGNIHGNQKNYPDLIAPIRQRLINRGGPYIIENVPGAPLLNPITLCGSMFPGLGVWRHRLFECNFFVRQPVCNHKAVPLPIDVTGTGGPCYTRTTPGGGIHRKPKNMAQAKAVMGIDWMIRREITQAIPPAYTEYIGKQLMQLIKNRLEER